MTSMRPLRNTQLHPVLKRRPALRLGAGPHRPRGVGSRPRALEGSQKASVACLARQAVLCVDPGT